MTKPRSPSWNLYLATQSRSSQLSSKPLLLPVSMVWPSPVTSAASSLSLLYDRHSSELSVCSILSYQSFFAHSVYLFTGTKIGDPKVDMAYKNYEADIVFKYGVALDGWPEDGFNLDNVSRGKLEDIYKALSNGTISWVDLTPEQLAHRRQTLEAQGKAPVRTARKERNDKGKKRGRRARSPGESDDEQRPLSAETINSDEGED